MVVWLLLPDLTGVEQGWLPHGSLLIYPFAQHVIVPAYVYGKVLVCYHRYYRYSYHDISGVVCLNGLCSSMYQSVSRKVVHVYSDCNASVSPATSASTSIVSKAAQPPPGCALEHSQHDPSQGNRTP